MQTLSAYLAPSDVQSLRNIYAELEGRIRHYTKRAP
jgi:hypothetical protein